MPLFLAPDWFKDTYIGIEVEQLIGIGALVVVAGAVHLLASQALRLYLRARLSAPGREFWDQERSRLRRALLALVVAITVLLGFPTLGFDPSVENVVNQVASLFGAVSLVLLGFRGIDIFTNVWKRRAEKTESHIDDQLVPLANTSLKGAVLLIGGLFVLGNLGVNVTSLVAGLGLGGLAIALAAQDTIRNLLGGVTIFADRPFQVGDWVVLNNIEGTVEHVGFRSSRVRTFYNSVVTVPNRASSIQCGQHGAAPVAALQDHAGAFLRHDSGPGAGLRGGRARAHPGQPGDAQGLLHRRVPRLQRGHTASSTRRPGTTSCARGTC